MPRYKKFYQNQNYLELYESDHKNYQCKYCGCKFNFNTHYTKEICNRCGKYNFKTKRDEFAYRLKERIEEQKRGDCNSSI